MRKIILHYHLFKNAGTSLDHVLKRNFPNQWVTAEFPNNGGNNTALVADWIRSEPNAVAFSSHTMLGALPRVAGVIVVPVVLMRDPVKRIESAYKFERQQESDNPGAVLAKEQDFEGYVRKRLENPGDRQCRNFHVARFAPFAPGPGEELGRAIRAAKLIHDVGVLGLVEEFNDLLVRLRKVVAADRPDFSWQEVRANTSEQEKFTTTAGFDAMLKEINKDDYALLDAAKSLLRS